MCRYNGLYYQTCSILGQDVYSTFVNDVTGVNPGLSLLTINPSTAAYVLSPNNFPWSEQHQPLSITWANDEVWTLRFWDTPSNPRPRTLDKVPSKTWLPEVQYTWGMNDGVHVFIGNAALDPKTHRLFNFLTWSVLMD